MDLASANPFDPRSGVRRTLPSSAFISQQTDLVGRLAAEMARRWRAGERPRAEDFLARYPELAGQPEAAVDLIYEEICLRQEFGDEVSPEEVLTRFPQWRPQLELLLECHRVLDPGRSAPLYPAAGEALGDFHLQAELGRGAQGRVFLATQPALSDRPVVLKLTAIHGQEHLSLARLQHTNIVPLYSAHDEPERNLRVLCMPYFGGASLSRLLERLADAPVEQRSGKHLLDALDAEAAAAQPPAPSHSPGRYHLARYSYVQSVCWIAGYLADALHYAYERGLVHLDLKPSNVLLAADGTPMLLDFHLARPPIRPDAPPPDWLGGTPAYMAPEQRAAVHALSEGRPIPAVVDSRADIYALGVLLYEALGGPVPLPTDRRPPRLDRLNREVGGDLADLVAKCLEEDPGRRYGTAADLAGDLRRYLEDRPLLGVRNRLPERWRKWRRRDPGGLRRLLGSVAAVLVVGLATAVTVLAFRWGQQQADLSVQAEARAEAAAAHARALWDLHALAAQLRFASAGDQLAAGGADTDSACRALWEQRQAILHGLDGESPAEQTAVRADVFDLALLWTDLFVRRAGQDEGAAEAARAEAVTVLAETEERFGPDPALDRARRTYGDTSLPPEPKSGRPSPRTVAEWYAEGRSLYPARMEEAETAFANAVRLDPQARWPQFYRGVCAYRLGHYQAAVEAFSACVALARDRHEAARHLYNRARAISGPYRGRLPAEDYRLALEDYLQALEYDPGLARAALNAAILEYRAGHYADALRHLDQAQGPGVSPATVSYHRAVVYKAAGNWDAALANAEEALRRDPHHADARKIREELRRPR